MRISGYVLFGFFNLRGCLDLIGYLYLVCYFMIDLVLEVIYVKRINCLISNWKRGEVLKWRF